MSKLYYLTNSDQTEAVASIINTGHDEKGHYLVLDGTIFYPQGGGQPSDIGIIKTGDNRSLQINFVRVVDGEVRHYTNDSSPPIGQNLSLQIDGVRRNLNTRYHSAGHLIASVAEANISGIVAIKGHQFPGEAYVEFTGVIENDNIMNILINELADSVASDATTLAKEISSEEFMGLFASLSYDIPQDKKLRIVALGDFPPVPCGGTHVKSLSEIGSIKISKIKSKQGRTKISYELL